MPILGVNVDHIATLREARKTFEPDPVEAAFIAEKAGAGCITVHLREDRRHIQDRDLRILKETVQTKLNLEMASSEEIVEIALSLRPHQVTIVPEKREELTTEGGLNVVKNYTNLLGLVKKFKESNILVSFFIDPQNEQVQASADCGANFVEFHTGEYANAKEELLKRQELIRLHETAELAIQKKLRVNAGHGLTHYNVKSVLSIPGLEELHIGHSIISRAVIVGLERSVREMVSFIS
ncbi:MAG: pyridoxine 5'-phosphate synthase [Candidatus Aureabacteria bacterium]|nr:pyridoxine 5'-phosphate synthase [Candidatus Auribacterota bacterium]